MVCQISYSLFSLSQILAGKSGLHVPNNILDRCSSSIDEMAAILLPPFSQSTAAGAHHLIDEVLEVLIAEGLGGPDDLMQIRVHQVLYQVQVLEVLPRGQQQLLEADHILVPQVAQQHALPQRPPVETPESNGVCIYPNACAGIAGSRRFLLFQMCFEVDLCSVMRHVFWSSASNLKFLTCHELFAHPWLPKRLCLGKVQLSSQLW